MVYQNPAIRFSKKSALVAVCGTSLIGALGAVPGWASQPKLVPKAGTSFPIPITGSGGAFGLVTVAPAHTVSCGASTLKTEFTSSTTFANTVITLTGCESSGTRCTSAGQASGTVVTNSLNMTLYYVRPGSSEVGLDLVPTAGAAAPLATFTCAFGLETMKVTGSVVGILTPVNTLANGFTLTFAQSAGVQSPSSYLDPSGCKVKENILNTEGSGAEKVVLRSEVATTETLSVIGGKEVKFESIKCT